MRPMAAHRAWRSTLGAAVLLAGVCFLPAEPRAEAHVLVISAFDRHDAILEPTEVGIREHLSARPGTHLSFEYLDAGHRPGVPHRAAFERFLSVKYAAVEVDVLVALGEPALTFALDTREDLFAEAWLVHGEAPGVTVPPETPRVLGFPSRYGFAETLDVMQELHPSRTNVLIVDDATERVRWLRQSLAVARAEVEDALSFRETAGQTLTAIETEVAGLGPEDIVLYLSYAQGLKDTVYDERQALVRISSASAVPVYAALPQAVGFGAVGGYVLQPFELGRQIGARIDALLGPGLRKPSSAEAPHAFVFDFRQLARFGIAEDALPSESYIIEEPDTFYFRYRRYLWAAVAVIAAMAIYIAVLIAGLARRERVLRGLERLIAAGETALPINQPAALFAGIETRLRRVVPDFREVRFEPALATGGEALRPKANRYMGPTAVLALTSDGTAPTQVHCRAGRRLDAIDQRLLDLTTHTLAIECENLRAAQLSTSLDMARRIQAALLPKDFAEIGARYGLDIHAQLIAAREVGGDLYDVFEPTPGRLLLAIGDVADKGVPAALVMGITRTHLRGLAETETRPERLLARLNRRLAAENDSLMFVTLLVAMVERGSNRITVASAGHNPPLLRARDGCVRPIDTTANIALGVFGHAEYVASEHVIGPGETLLAFTDGVTEAENADGAQLGEARLCEVLSRANVSSRETVEAVLAETRAFAHGAPQSDDIALLALQRR